MKIYKLVLLLISVAFSNVYSQYFWEKTAGPDTTTIHTLAINSSGVIFAGADYGSVFRSTDNGNTWTNQGIENSDTNHIIRDIFIDLGDDIWLATDNWGGVRKSTDNGNSWDNLGFAHFDESIAIKNSNGYIFVGTGALGIYRSTDNGGDLGEINNGMTASFISPIILNSSEDIFAGTIQGGVFRSTDDGDNWVQINQGLTTNYILSLAINSSDHIFAGTSGGGIYRSTDNGDNWVQINQGLSGEGLYIFATAINPSGDIFVGTGAGVYRSTDNGDNWVQINQGLTNIYSHRRSLAINSNGDVYLGTEAGIFRTNPSANIKVFLQGPYASGSMNTTLRTNGYLPLAQPYNVAPFNYSGTESVASIPAGVVDWVLLELRSDLTTQVSRRAAFLLSDGSVVDLDGVSTVRFPGVTPGDYYVVVRHRNHLAIMTTNPITLSYSPGVYDFSNAETQAYGTNAMKDLGSGTYGLYTGDANSDGFVTSTDFNIFNPKFTSAASGYEYSDWNLDGIVTSTDFNYFNPNFTTAKQTFVP